MRGDRHSDVAAADPARFPCPCCGYLVFDEAPGSYDFCRICGWQDDLSQLRFPRSWGANKISLISAQKNFEQTGSRDPARPSLFVQPPTATDVRDPGWRALDEAADDIEEPVPGVDYGLTYPDDHTKLYYWRSSFWR